MFFGGGWRGGGGRGDVKNVCEILKFCLEYCFGAAGKWSVFLAGLNSGMFAKLIATVIGLSVMRFWSLKAGGLLWEWFFENRFLLTAIPIQVYWTTEVRILNKNPISK